MDKKDVTLCVCVYIYIYTHIYIMEYFSVIKKHEMMPFAATEMGLEMIILSEVSQTKKDKYHV